MGRRKFNPRQPRDLAGRWKSAHGSKSWKSAAPKRTNSRIAGSVPDPIEGKSPYYTDRKGDFTADTRNQTSAQARRRAKKKADALAKANEQKIVRGIKYKRNSGPANAVPYVRVSPRAVGAGVDAGTPVGKKFRLSAGAYVRVSRVNIGAKEKAASDNFKAAAPLTNIVLKKVQGKQVELPKGASFKVGTSEGGLPSVKIRKGYSRVSAEKSSEAVADYNNAMARRVKGKKVKGSRPQRRTKNSK